MKKIDTILFDLDGTLLEIDMNVFLPIYMEDIASFAHYPEGDEEFIKAIWKASIAMIENRQPGYANESIFFKTFCSLMGSSEEKWKRFFDNYYRNRFPLLSNYASCNPLAVHIIKEAKKQNYELVLATNPVFPLTAIEERLRWAQLDSSDFSFITNLNNMHWCKPSTNYYREILCHIKKAPHQCLMVGNDVAEDLPAGKIGITTYLVEDMMIHQQGQEINCHHRGTLKDLLAFLSL